MSDALLLVLNGLGCLFILFLIIKAIQIQRVIKQCQPIHKHGFKVSQSKKKLKKGFHIGGILCLWGLWIVGILMYSTIELIILYLAALMGMTSYYPLFNTGKIGERGVMIADWYIPWEQINNYSLQTLPVDHFHYPDAQLTLITNHQQTLGFIVRRKEIDQVSQLVKNKLPKQ